MQQIIHPSPQPESPTMGDSFGPAWEEMTDTYGRARPAWASLTPRILFWSADERSALASNADRLLDDLGATFNFYTDVGATRRPWKLDPLPLAVSSQEWSKVAAGLEQRTLLLDAILLDLYGPQHLLREGLIPPDLVHANPSFLANVRHANPNRESQLTNVSFDLIREPSGQWEVLRDHTRSPSGLGQTLQNRIVTSNILPAEFEACQVARLGPFFDLERDTLRCLSRNRGSTPLVVVLTPGFRHPSYFEHAYKARILGFPLVEPADLTVRERRLFLKTLSGLRRIDVVACRLHDDAIDPLEFWTLGGSGIPGLAEAWRTGNVTLANAPGAGFGSSTALMPFLPAICRKWFNEDLLLPFVETWWLGQNKIRRQVLDNPSRYILLPAFHPDPLLPLRFSTMSAASRRQWIATIEQRPHDFVVQRDTPSSITPSLEARSLKSRPVLWRAFTLNTKSGPSTLRGGLAIIGKSILPPTLWTQHAIFVKDVWITGDSCPATEHESPATPPPDPSPAAAEVPSRIAEQLFWVGRYAERIELAIRLLRATLHRIAGENTPRRQPQIEACLSFLAGIGILKEVSPLPPIRQALPTLISLLHDHTSPAGLVPLIQSLLWNAAAARDRLSDDTWRLFNHLESLANNNNPQPRIPELLQTLDSLLLHLSAFSGLQAENMTRGHGWRFLEIGRRIERAIGILSLLHTAHLSGETALEPLLETCDSVMTYRRRHFSKPHWQPVLDLLFADHTNPRSLAAQSAGISAVCAKLPGEPNYGLLPRIHQHVAKLAILITPGQPQKQPDFTCLHAAFEELSDLLTQHYFAHAARRVY